jgi:transcriptional regulator with XRE-family HTH domain
MDTIHARIRECRKALKLSQEALAEASGVSRQAVQQWETEPDPENPEVLSSAPRRTRLAKVARALGVSEEWLLTGRDPDGQTHDPIKAQLDMFYAGMSEQMRHALVAHANTLHNLSNPDADGRFDPFGGKKPPKGDK